MQSSASSDFHQNIHGNLQSMFGPLNGVRTALVIAAAAAAIACFVAGFVSAGVVLLIGVAMHGLGWLYLYRQGTSEDDPTIAS